MIGHRVCVRCVMDTTDSQITFDERGFCNHCRFYEEHTARLIYGDEKGRSQLGDMVAQAKHEGRSKAYNVIIGLSGGVDSSYLGLKARELGLRPLAIHLDNSWDSEPAVHNIERVVRTLELDLVTHVVDWQEFRDIQRAFIAAGVVDIELITDHAITALAHRVARDQGIRWVLSGTNHVTESIMPTTWMHRKTDLRNLKAIHRRFGTRPLRTLPTLSMVELQWNLNVRRLRSIAVLNYLPYTRAGAIEELQRELGWQDYGGKHHESLWTRFYQAHILPVKFGVDKRKAHLSAQICSEQISRDEALRILEDPLYPPAELRHDQDYVLKKLGFTETQFAEIMATPPRRHLDFASDESYIAPLLAGKRLAREAAGKVRRRAG